MRIFFKTVLLLIQSGLAALTGYLLALTAAALVAPQQTPLAHPALSRRRFLILVPAHNEERLLPDLLHSLLDLNYPRDHFTIHVVADNCTDGTAQIARNLGAIVHERESDTEKGKGYALQWLLQRLWLAEEPHDAIVIFDADTIVDPEFLNVMNAKLIQGAHVIQGYYAVRDPDRSWGVALRYAALAALHYLRPLGRTSIGGSAGLKGNGMVFRSDIARWHTWTSSLTEDIEFHMALLISGERVDFAPDAVLWAEMPATLAASQTQHTRWERGRLEMARKYVPQLIRYTFVRGNFACLDAAMEHVIPPFSLLTAFSGAGLLGAFAMRSRAGIALGAATLAGQVAYALTGLWLARAPFVVYRALVFAPMLIVWKLWLYLRVIIGLDRGGWIRTDRGEVDKIGDL